MPNGLSNYIVYKRFAVQTRLWSLEFVIPDKNLAQKVIKD